MENSYVVALVDGDTLELVRRNDGTVIVFGCKDMAKKVAEEFGGDYSVYDWC